MADAAMAPVPVLLVLSPEAVRCSTRCDTAVLFAKLYPYAERHGLEGLVIPTAEIIEHKRLHAPPRNGHAKEVVPYSKWGPEYNWRTERRKHEKRQSMEASSAKLRLATEARQGQQQVGKIRRKKHKK
ncbi:hypothetical protein JB92DRAFT_2828361 [Gautieria morchelliformis]|nr:hypothetical protein JB92DRAFT_2828361 [Gautieria morchelliformis]